VGRRRLDAELVSRGMARSREHARELITSGAVVLNGLVAHKPATQVDATASLAVRDVAMANQSAFVSRGAVKLAGALDHFNSGGLDVSGRRCLDAGASTGGFTEVLLQRGAHSVVAVDVGYGQLAWKLQQDLRVRVMDRTNVRYLQLSDLEEPVDVVVADLSFISLELVLPALVGVSTPSADLLVMVKPQFEVGRERLGAGGVVRDSAMRVEAVCAVGARAKGLGLGVRGVVASSLPGPAGNVEYFLWLNATAPPLVVQDVERAVNEGPK